MRRVTLLLACAISLSAQEPRFFQWTNDIAASQLSQRTTAISNIHTVAAAEARKTAVRATILQLIGGLPQSSAPLNAQITGSIDMGNYVIQKILFESMPNLIVSANLYLPKTSGTHPAVLFQIGHFDGGKTYDQITPGNLALKGFVVLAYDPIGEGERIQDYDPTTQQGVAGGATSQHLMAGAQSLLMGQNYARYEIFEAQRALDYLTSRPEVDATRIGATGCSGGGTLTTYVAMLDPRIKAAAPACYMNSYQALYPENNIGDSEQSFTSLLSSGLDEADFVELFSPGPWLILSTQGDFFTPAGAQIVYDEASQWYSLYSAASKVQFVVAPGDHGTPVEDRQAIYAWMIQYLNNNAGDSTEQTVTTLPDSQLQASSTGQVGGLQIYQVIRTTPRTPGSPADLAALLNQTVAHPSQIVPVTVNSTTDNGVYRTQSISFTTEAGLTLDAQLLLPDSAGVKPGVVFVETLALASAAAKQLAVSGNVVLDLMPRGLPSGADPTSYIGDWVTDVRALLIGRSLPGMRAYDILQGVEILSALPNVDAAHISGNASGISGFWMLLAAAADTRLSSLRLDQTPYSFQPAFDSAVHYSLHDAVINGFFRKFDIPDLAAALNGRPIFWTNPADWLHHVVPQVSALAISMSHAGNFTQGQQNAAYTIAISNSAAAMMTTGTVTVTENLPAGLSLVSMAGAGWSCSGATCTRSDSVMPGQAFQPVAVTVNVAVNAPPSLSNAASVSGGGSANTNASDPTVIAPVLAVWSITKTHSGNFAQGQQNAVYAVILANTATAGASSGTVTVTENPPAGLTIRSMAGTGWTCSGASCTRSDGLAGGSSFAPITVAVNVASGVASPLINSVTVTGGGAQAASATDSTVVVAVLPALSIAKSHTGSFSQQGTANYVLTVSDAAGAGPSSGLVTVTENLPAAFKLISMTGAGWSCATNICTRADVLAPANSYPPIAVQAHVDTNASSPQVNSATVSGGGSAAASATDSAVVLAVAATLSLNRTALNFSESGSTVTDPQNVTLSFTAGSGTAWSAASNQPGMSITPASGTGSGILRIAVTGGPSGIVTITAPGATNSPQQIQMNVAAMNAGAPFGSFDTPSDHSSGITGAIAVTGWALDPVEVTKVDIWREPVTGESSGLVYIGDAVLVDDARPDVESANPAFPFSYRAGWGYLMLTTSLPNSDGSRGVGNGTYKLHAIAHNKTGASTDLGVRTIICDNAHAAKPFGTIDTPSQGGIVSGANFVNFGWALTQNPNAIPLDGSTIAVTIDGQPVGHPTYNQFRSDIANLFPGLANSDGAIGYLFIDTTALSNGVHTIAWLVYDNAGRGDGLGSRFFTVLNATSNTGAAFSMAPEAKPSEVLPIEIEELQPLRLGVDILGGYLSINGERRALPPGSSIKDGVFYWQTAPGLLGRYDLILTRQNGALLRAHVTIHPKRY